MSTWDDFDAKLECPKCGRKGVVRLRQADGHAYARDKSTRVIGVPDGFSVIDKIADDPKFSCMQCGGEIESK